MTPEALGPCQWGSRWAPNQGNVSPSHGQGPGRQPPPMAPSACLALAGQSVKKNLISPSLAKSSCKICYVKTSSLGNL